VPGDAIVYCFTATTKLYCVVTEVARGKQVTQCLVPDKPERGVELCTVSCALNASVKSDWTPAVGHLSQLIKHYININEKFKIPQGYRYFAVVFHY